MKETARQAIDLLKVAIKKESKSLILAAYELVETDEFSWDDLDNEWSEWSDLEELANDIIYS